MSTCQSGWCKSREEHLKICTNRIQRHFFGIEKQELVEALLLLERVNLNLLRNVRFDPTLANREFFNPIRRKGI